LAGRKQVTTVLHLGVLDVPYSTGGTSTGDVAGYLENKYHVMEHFAELHQDEIGTALLGGLESALQSLERGVPVGGIGVHWLVQKIETAFRQMLTNAELEGLGYPGIPTQASLDRRSGKRASVRFKYRGKRRRSPKSLTGPSFIDSGLYQKSFRAWMET
jgi:hypothetical protein